MSFDVNAATQLDRFFDRIEAIGALLALANGNEDGLPGHALETVGMMLIEMSDAAKESYGRLRSCGAT